MSKEDVILKTLEKFENKVDNLDSRLDTIEKVLVKQEANIDEHMRRTDLAEENMDLLRRDMVPVQAHISRVEGALKFIGIVGTVVGIAVGILKLAEFLV